MLEEKNLPPRGAGKLGKSYVRSDIEEFVESGLDCAKISFEGKSIRTLSQTIRSFLKRSPKLASVVKTSIRNGELYLVRKKS